MPTLRHHKQQLDARQVTATMHDANDAAKFYSYPFSQMVITYLLMPVVSLISLVLGAFLLKADSP